jgi:ferredoxin
LSPSTGRRCFRPTTKARPDAEPTSFWHATPAGRRALTAARRQLERHGIAREQLRGCRAGHRDEWFRQAGTDGDPGTALVTVAGAVTAPGVYEIEHGLALKRAARGRGGVHRTAARVSAGWLRRRLDRRCRRRSGQAVAPGARAAARTAGPRNRVRAARQRLPGGRDRAAGRLAGRGACAHRDGAASSVTSAVRVFRDELSDHARHGPCDACQSPTTLPIPERAGGDRMTQRIEVDPIACQAHGMCAELLPELIELDDWGYPVIADVDVARRLRPLARRAVTVCPTLALRLRATTAATPAARSRRH